MNESNLQRKPKRSEKSDSDRVRDFQRKLYRKAKQEKDFRFYVLYDKICLMYVLREAYRRVKANRGAPGADGMTFGNIEKEGLREFLERLRNDLQEKTYRPQPVLRVMIPKANGGERPLGIPTIRDRIAQMACKMIIEPIFEADFHEGSYGFRPKRSARDAVENIKENLKSGRTHVLDADLSQYFDTIPHEKLLFLIGKRISDKNILHLIKLWLKTPVKEGGRIKGGKKNKYGTPQGGVISPLLANIYLNLIDHLITRLDAQPEDIRIVRYADDFVIMGRVMSGRVLDKLNDVLERMEVQLNKSKTRLVDASIESFDFLGFTFQHRWSRWKRGERYLHIQPSKKSLSKLRSSIKVYLKRSGHHPRSIVIRGLNMKLRGWLNYFDIPGTSHMWKSADMINWYLWESIKRFHERKSQRYSTHYSYNAYRRWVEKHGLINPKMYCKHGTVKA